MNRPAPSTPPAGPTDPGAPAEGGEARADGDGSPRSGRGFFTELPILIIIAFVLALLLKTFLVQAFFIPSSSMEPTLDIGDRVLVNKLSYKLREPRRGELVVFTERIEGVPDERSAGQRVVDFLSSGLGVARPGERDFIKRIIGLPGETIEMHDGLVLIDGQPLPEAPTVEGGYLSAVDPTDFGPVEIPEDHYFMMGDNRPNSSDSRFALGPIASEDLIGRAFVVIWPLPRVDTLPIADYPAGPERVSAAPPMADHDPQAAQR
ncbi:MAG TPA: signal peptidase I [Egibacteraceae bacterium]|nr:signal peptidase I [Egibacteraceae bacterium]